MNNAYKTPRNDWALNIAALIAGAFCLYLAYLEFIRYTN